MYKGWIMALEDEAEELESMGIVLGPYNKKEWRFENCQVSKEALVQLDPHWNRFYWGLAPTAWEK